MDSENWEYRMRKDFYYGLLLDALIASGDLDVAHAKNLPTEQIWDRWKALGATMLSGVLTVVQQKRFAAWIETGLLHGCLDLLEKYREDLELIPWPPSRVDHDMPEKNAWWSQFGLVCQDSKILQLTIRHPVICSAFKAQQGSVLAYRTIGLLSGSKFFSSSHDPSANSEMLQYLEGFRYYGLTIVHNLLYCVNATEDESLRSVFLQPYYHAAVRLALTSREPIMPAIRQQKKSVVDLPWVQGPLRQSCKIFRDAIQWIQKPHPGDPLISVIIGPSHKTLLGDMMEIIEHSNGMMQIEMTYLITTVVSLDGPKLYFDPDESENYCTRWVSFAKRLFAHRPDDEEKDEFQENLSLALCHVIRMWEWCILSAWKVEPVAAAIQNGLIFVLERFSVECWDSADQGGFNRILEYIPLILAIGGTDMGTSMSALYYRQCEIVHYRIGRNRRVSKALKDAWRRHGLSQEEERLGAVDVYCALPGCESIQKATLKCTGCKQEYYCAKECQKSHWKEHKISCRKVQG
ncbi:hypothetical protein DL93DRAFT_2232217 [Clavulina sp. PMI_390]|nr:hypothetical protein DL93DRAFT_2232217 [Clavulina sp. PMI_390]